MKIKHMVKRRVLNRIFFYGNIKTYDVFIVMRFGGMAARNRPMGRKAAKALRKSLKPSPPPSPLGKEYVYS